MDTSIVTGTPTVPLSTTANDTEIQFQNLPDRDRWIKDNIAVLVCHGIGNQRALETLDAFATNLLKTIADATGLELAIEHRSECKKDEQAGGAWFDNYVRIRLANVDSPYLDVHEYYWAYLTEDQATFHEIRTWLRGVVKGAKSFYERDVHLVTEFEKKDAYFTKVDKKGNVKFRAIKYKWFLYRVGIVLPALEMLSTGLLELLGRLPFVGGIFASAAKAVEENLFHNVTNVLGDLTIYNTCDEKQQHNVIRRKILNGAVTAIQDLLQDKGETADRLWKYDRILVAGHSLGSQIAFDAINRINFLIQTKQIKGVDINGRDSVSGEKQKLAKNNLFAGLVTFGSPLDKIAFFLRDDAPKGQQLRQEILNDFYGFKQRDWSPVEGIRVNGYSYKLKHQFVRLFDDVPWKNYYDHHDPVSGSLEFYLGVENVRCQFKGRFTHSQYWDHEPMYRAVYEMLAPRINDTANQLKPQDVRSALVDSES